MMKATTRKSARVGMLAAVSAPLPSLQQELPRRTSPAARRREAGALRALVTGVEQIGPLPPDRGAVRHRVRVLVAGGATVAANFNRPAEGDAWVSIERVSVPAPTAETLAAAELRMRETFPEMFRGYQEAPEAPGFPSL